MTLGAAIPAGPELRYSCHIMHRVFLAVVLTCGWLVSGFSAQAPYRILLTNDDGVHAPGLEAMAEALRLLGEVTVVAPLENQSGKGHALTLGSAIYRTDLTLLSGMAAVGLTATPVTTVKVALDQIMIPPPDILVSGINRGYNLAMAAYVSGTVGAAREAALQGVPAVASSRAYTASNDVGSYRAAAEMTARIVAIVKARGIPKGVWLSVNVPEGTTATLRGLRLTTQGAEAGGAETFEMNRDADGRMAYRGRFVEGGTDVVEGSDTWAVSNGWVAVTPLRIGEFADGDLDTLAAIIK